VPDGAGELPVDGCVLRYWARGEGSPVVLTHGAGADHQMFVSQVEALARAGYRAVTWDMRGHGRSRPNGSPFTARTALTDLVALLEHLDLEAPVLVGQSLGGNLAQALTRRFPERVRGVVVIGSAWNAGPVSTTERALLKLAAPVLRTIPSPLLPGLMARASATTDGARADLRRAFGTLSKEDFIRTWAAAVELLEPDPGYRTPVPLCLIRGAEDRTGNIATAMPAWARHQGVAEHVVEGAGHVANQDDASSVNAVLLDFLGHLGRVEGR